MKNRKWKLAVYLFIFASGFCLSGRMMEAQRVLASEAESTEVTSAQTVHTEETIHMNPPQITKCTATLDGKIKLVWSAVKNADQYEVFRSKSKEGEYTQIGTTSKKSFTDKSGKKLQTYYYKVRAMQKNDATGLYGCGDCSKTVKKKVRKKAQRTAYAGDSVMRGFAGYKVIPSGGKNRFFAEVGMHLHTFYEGDMLKDLLKYKPDRLFIMLGMNGLVGSPGEGDLSTKADYFKKIIRACQKKNPDMEIVVMGVSPVGREATVKKDTVVRFNEKLKKLVKPMPEVRYYDTWEVLADSQGYLKGQYGGGDGVHWQKSGYEAVRKDLNRFIREY